MTGRQYPEWAGKVHFWMMFIGANLTFFPQHFLGRQGMPRRYIDYPEQFALWNYVSSMGAFLSGLSFLFFFGIVFYTLRYGARVTEPMYWGPQPDATLEWTLSNPPPEHTFEILPTPRHVGPQQARTEAAMDGDGSRDAEPPAPIRSSGADPPILALTLWPHRSLSPQRVRLGASAIVGLRAWRCRWSALRGHRRGLGAAAVPARGAARALRGDPRELRDGRLTEELRLWPDLITVVRREPKGRVRRWHANPFWVRLRLHDDDRVEKYLTLTGQRPRDRARGLPQPRRARGPVSRPLHRAARRPRPLIPRRDEKAAPRRGFRFAGLIFAAVSRRALPRRLRAGFPRPAGAPRSC